LFFLSFPIVITNLLQVGYNLADTFWLGRFSTEALAAISLGFPLVYLFISLGLGLTVAGSVLVAQHTGADQPEKAEYAASQTVIFTLLAGVGLGVAGFSFVEELLQVFGAEPAVLALAVEYMEALIDELLALAREGKVVSETEPVSLSAVAEDAWKRIDADDTDFLGAPERTVSADRPRLRELFENLFRNAVEHTGPGVTVRVETEETGFAVVDDGPGIAPERREKVFERRFSTADGGTGLGLSIVERIAEAHGWSVTATEGNAGGTRIVIETAVGPTGDGPEGESAGTDPSGSGAVDG
jgi:hypothetical protein